jgi:hypothetical protein
MILPNAISKEIFRRGNGLIIGFVLLQEIVLSLKREENNGQNENQQYAHR